MHTSFRFFVAFLVLTGLLGSTGFADETKPLSNHQKLEYHEAHRLLREQTGIVFEGPFRGGYFRPNDLIKPEHSRQKNDDKIAPDFKLIRIYFSERTYYDQVFISFTFAGEEDPNRKMLVRLTIYDGEGTVIGGATIPFDDPRIFAKIENARDSMYHVDPVSSLSTRLGGKTKRTITEISRIEISAVEIYDKPRVEKEPEMERSVIPGQ